MIQIFLTFALIWYGVTIIKENVTRSILTSNLTEQIADRVISKAQEKVINNNVLLSARAAAGDRI